MKNLELARAELKADTLQQPGRQIYQKPELSIIGDMKTLTAAGTPTVPLELFDEVDLPRP
jgi:hypothetical protein